jgi:hypothetical protein
MSFLAESRARDVHFSRWQQPALIGMLDGTIDSISLGPCLSALVFDILRRLLRSHVIASTHYPSNRYWLSLGVLVQYELAFLRGETSRLYRSPDGKRHRNDL